VIIVEVSTAAEMSAAILQHAGTDCTIRWENSTVKFTSVSALRPRRDRFQKKVEALAKEWAKLPRSQWPKHTYTRPTRATTRS